MEGPFVEVFSEAIVNQELGGTIPMQWSVECLCSLRVVSWRLACLAPSATHLWLLRFDVQVPRPELCPTSRPARISADRSRDSEAIPSTIPRQSKIQGGQPPLADILSPIHLLDEKYIVSTVPTHTFLSILPKPHDLSTSDTLTATPVAVSSSVAIEQPSVACCFLRP